MRKILFLISIALFTAQPQIVDNAPHPRAANVPEGLTTALGKQPDKFLPELVDFLTSGIKDPFSKIKVIHDWIALNIDYDVDAYLGRSDKIYDPDNVIKYGRTICEGYSSLFGKMCRLADINCEEIHGYGKGMNFSPFEKIEPESLLHSWNAVKIMNNWYLIDVTWDAGYTDGAEFIEEYSTAYLFLAPDKFILTHYPYEPEWQFLDDPVNYERFIRYPSVTAKFFEHDIGFTGDISSVTDAGDSHRIILTAPSDILGMASLFDRQRNELSERALVQRRGDSLVIDASFPSSGRYTLLLFTKKAAEEGAYWSAAEFGFFTDHGTNLRFPVVYSAFITHNCYIHEPLGSPLPIIKENKKLFFDVEVENVEGVGIKTITSFTDLKKTGKNRYSGNVELAPGEIVLYYKQGNRMSYLCTWKAEY